MRTAIDAEKFMERLRNGETPKAIISGKLPGGIRVRGMSTYRGFREHCAADPTWGREAADLVEKNAAAAQKRKCSRLTHCKRGHLLAGDNVGYKRDTNGKFYRYCMPCDRLRTTWAADMTPAEVRRVTAAVKAGFKIQEITKSTPSRRLIVGFAKLRQYRVTHPEFDRFIIENSRDLRSSAVLRQCRIVPANAKFEYSAPAIIKPARRDIPPFMMREDDMPWVLSLIPKSVPDHARYDVLQDVFMALSVLVKSIAKRCRRWCVSGRPNTSCASRTDEIPRSLGRLTCQLTARDRCCGWKPCRTACGTNPSPKGG